MIDYEDIPAHIRCTKRGLIVPNYPGNLIWWRKIHERRAEVKRNERAPKNHYRKMSELSKKTLALLEERGEMAQSEIAAILGVKTDNIVRVAHNLMDHVLIYEGTLGSNAQGRQRTSVTYGILDREDDDPCYFSHSF